METKDVPNIGKTPRYLVGNTEIQTSEACLLGGLPTRSDHSPHISAIRSALSQGRCVHARHTHWAGCLRLVSWQATVFPFCDGGCRASTRIGDSICGCEGLAQTIKFTVVLRVINEVVEVYLPHLEEGGRSQQRV